MPNPLVMGSGVSGITSRRYVQTAYSVSRSRPSPKKSSANAVPVRPQFSREMLQAASIESSRRMKTTIVRVSEGPGQEQVEEPERAEPENTSGSRRVSGRRGGEVHEIDINTRSAAGMNALKRSGAAAFRQESHAFAGNFFNAEY